MCSYLHWNANCLASMLRMLPNPNEKPLNIQKMLLWPFKIPCFSTEYPVKLQPIVSQPSVNTQIQDVYQE